VITRIVLILLVVAGTAACGGEPDESGAKRVVAGFYPLAFAAEQIRGVDVEVTNLTPAGAEPHDLELTPREVEEILDADLVLYLGEGFQPAVEEAVETGDVPALDVLDGLELRDGDPHVWLDPTLFAQVVDRIAVELGDEGATGSRGLATRLDELDQIYEAGLADCERRELVTTHDAFGYLADRYGLEVIPITGLSPEAEPSPQDLEEVVDLVEARGVTTVFTETLLSPEVGETVAREAGATTAVLNPLEGLTEDELARGEDYFSVMEANLEALRQGLGCR
jgi:zinc transport system substrate-binding protein